MLSRYGFSSDIPSSLARRYAGSIRRCLSPATRIRAARIDRHAEPIGRHAERWPWAGIGAVPTKEFSFLLWSRPYEEAVHACPGQGPEAALRTQGWRCLLAIEGGGVR